MAGNQFNPSQQNAFDLMESTLKAWGLGSLIPDLRKIIIGGITDQSELALQLSQTDAYKQRFSANAARIKAGLPELNPAQYIGLEDSYRSIMRQFGLPQGFYDSHQALDQFIAGDVSPAEMQSRVQAAADLVYNSPKEAMQAWDQFYGGGKGGAIAAVLDPKTAAPLVEREVSAAQIGGAALQQGLTTNKASAERFASEGVTLDQARQAYSNIAQRMPVDQALNARFGGNVTQATEEAATFEGDASALKAQDTLYKEEGSMFAGHGGASVQSADVGTNY